MATSKQRRPVYRPPLSRRQGITGALFDAGIIIGATLITTLLLLFISGQLRDTTSGNLTWLPARQPTAVTLPTPRPSPSAQSTRPAATPTTASPTGGGTEDARDDGAIQAEVEKRIAENPSLAPQGITATVSNGKVILVGAVPTSELKDRIEKLVRGVKGVKEVNNQIIVVSGAPNPI